MAVEVQELANRSLSRSGKDGKRDVLATAVVQQYNSNSGLGVTTTMVYTYSIYLIHRVYLCRVAEHA